MGPPSNDLAKQPNRPSAPSASARQTAIYQLVTSWPRVRNAPRGMKVIINGCLGEPVKRKTDHPSLNTFFFGGVFG